jgi:hypothetical protein
MNGPTIKLRSRRDYTLLKRVLYGFIAIVTSFVPFYYYTYRQCIDDTRKFFDEYMSLRRELNSREIEIASQILKARSISDLRKGVDSRKFFSAKYKDYDIAELQLLYSINSESVDETGINKSAEAELKNSPLYSKYSDVFYGHIDEKINDSDLKDLQLLAVNIGRVEFIQFVTDVRSVSEFKCASPKNVLAIMLGEKPVTLQRYDAGSFVEKQRLRSAAKRNFLSPRVAPPPFPDTTFRPNP